MIVNVYEVFEDIVKFKTTDDKRMRTSKIRYKTDGTPYFKGFKGMTLLLSECINNASAYGDREALKSGVIGYIYA